MILDERSFGFGGKGREGREGREDRAATHAFICFLVVNYPPRLVYLFTTKFIETVLCFFITLRGSVVGLGLHRSRDAYHECDECERIKGPSYESDGDRPVFEAS